MRESDYQAYIIDTLSDMFPDCFILKNDSGYRQGIPDLTIFWRDQWAMLEVKASKDTPHQPNQEYYIRELDKLSFAAFIYPENEEEVLHDLQQTFRPRRSARVSQR